MSILNVAAYKFVELTDLASRRQRLRKFCHEMELRGTLLLAEEGINLFVAGAATAVRSLIDRLEDDPEIGRLETKESHTDYQPFTRMLVKVKQEIIAFGVEGVAPAQYTSKRISPAELKEWLDQQRTVLLLDTRNEYEVDLGTFAGAEHLGIGHFRDFPAAAERLPKSAREQPVVTFCTGGIRCEKAAPMLEQLGFSDVYQLDGGILNYFAQVGGAHYRGDCFVFDQRVAVDAALRETDAAQCYACQAILTPEDQQSSQYVQGESCPHCYCTTDEAMRAAIAQRHEAIRRHATPLPGSQAYDNYRPLHVAGACGGLPLLDFLATAVPSVEPAYWTRAIAEQRILLDGVAVAANRTVVAGEKYEHLVPNVIEPAVNPDIRILHEDGDLVVVDKPAPLPIHPAGRYNKNTLVSLLAPVYVPERLRHVHRLDANTTGIVLLARRRLAAKRLQMQFSAGLVEKRYVACVLGHPADDEFVCTAPIAREAASAGVRLIDEQVASARTEFKVLERRVDGTALVSARLVTGRTNQIRLHLWSLGLPIVGDPTYVAGGEVRHRQSLDVGEPPMCLHAWSIAFQHPRTGEQVTFEAPLPSWAESPAAV